ncbi:MAG: class I SAM-dependent methyltransferase [Flavobacteriales bacterium]|nr:class I SAM-dependent methyltransferase [Flavobacteriales bacterium]MDW8431171.1 class I SAM-dependent methyltransferase [Flavobacteriales bacterium]
MTFFSDFRPGKRVGTTVSFSLKILKWGLLGLFLSACSSIYTVKVFLKNSFFVADSARICRSYERELAAYRIQNGQRVADIGFGYGHVLGALALCHDSMTLYGVEVNKYSVLYGDSLMRRFAALKSKPQAVRWQLIRGKKKRCLLPDSSFDRIIIRETYHHFKRPGALMPDIIKKLAPDGLLCIQEEDPEKTYFSKNCKAYIMQRDELIQELISYGLCLVSDDTLTTPFSSLPNWVDSLGMLRRRVYLFGREGTCGHPSP